MENISDAITSANRKFMDVFKKGDATGLAALYTRDAKLLPPDHPMINGTEAIRSFWQGAMNMGIKEATLETVEVEARADLAYEIGRFTLIIQPQGGERMTTTGKYVVVWKNQDGSWKLHVDVWNTNASA